MFRGRNLHAGKTPARSWFGAVLAGLSRARAGNVAIVTALAVPGLATLTLGAVDLSNVMSDRSRMKDIADGAALSGARNLAVAIDEQSAIENAKATAQAMISEWKAAPAVQVSATLADLPDQGRGVKVQLSAHRDSLFGNLLPPGGWSYSTSSTATTVNSMPLCVLSFDDKLIMNFVVGGDARIQAPTCLIHSNGNLQTIGTGRIIAGQAQATGSARGEITPDPVSDAPPIKDPFTNRQLSDGSSCSGNMKKTKILSVTKGAYVLPAGIHCGDISVKGNATLTLAPGDHFFQGGQVEFGGNSRIQGKDVVLIFDSVSFFELEDNTQISFSGRESGVNAGFVLMASRKNNKVFKIDSTRIERLDGIIYVPTSRLAIGGTSDIARQSDWTVIVAHTLSLSGNPRLYLNTDYAASPIDVPAGVGPRQGARLVE